MVDALAAELHGAGGRIDELQDRLFPAVDLPQPLSPTRPQGLAGGDVEADAIDGVDVADDAREHALVHGEILLEPLDLQ